LNFLLKKKKNGVCMRVCVCVCVSTCLFVRETHFHSSLFLNVVWLLQLRVVSFFFFSFLLCVCFF